MWIPSHIGIRGSTAADTAAILALSSTIIDCKVSYSDFKPLIIKYVISLWLESWNQETSIKLHSITPEVDVSNLTMGLSRREEQVIHRTRMGHTYLTHSHLLKGEDAPTCIPCDCPLKL
jgi:hypothetical protein